MSTKKNTEELQAVRHTRNTGNCNHCKKKINKIEGGCCCYLRNKNGDLVKCGGDAQDRAHVNEGSKFWLMPACKKCNAQHGSKMYADPDDLYSIDDDRCHCDYRKNQSSMKHTRRLNKKYDNDSDAGSDNDSDSPRFSKDYGSDSSDQSFKKFITDFVINKGCESDNNSDAGSDKGNNSLRLSHDSGSDNNNDYGNESDEPDIQDIKKPAKHWWKRW